MVYRLFCFETGKSKRASNSRQYSCLYLLGSELTDVYDHPGQIFNLPKAGNLDLFFSNSKHSSPSLFPFSPPWGVRLGGGGRGSMGKERKSPGNRITPVNPDERMVLFTYLIINHPYVSAGETTQLVKCLPCKQGDPSSNPQN